MINREILKKPIPPKLNNISIEALTSLCFKPKTNLTSCDILFVPGGSSSVVASKAILEALNTIHCKNLLISGGNNEAHTYLSELQKLGFNQKNYILETKSQSSLENILFSLNFDEFKNAKSIISVVKHQHSGRFDLTLRKYLSCQLEYWPYNRILEDGTQLGSEIWFMSEEGRSRIWGEYLRICLYGERGDILLTDEVKRSIEIIESEIARP